MSRPSHFSGAYTLVSNNTYTVNGTTYQTDAKGRISSFSGKNNRRFRPPARLPPSATCPANSRERTPVT